MYINPDVVELMKFAVDSNEALNEYSDTIRVAALEKAERELEDNLETEIFDTILTDDVDELGCISVSIDTDGNDMVTITFVDNDGAATSMEVELSEEELDIDVLEKYADEYMNKYYLPIYDELFERDEDEDDDDDDYFYDVLDDDDDMDGSILDIIDYYETH